MSSVREVLLARFNILPSELNRIILTAPHRYKTFMIPKRKSGEFRQIAQPAGELKAIQNILIDEVLMELPIHSAAVAYRDGIGIKKNALVHKNNRFMLKMDFKDFFPSILTEDVSKHLIKYGEGKFSQEDIGDISRLILWVPKGSKIRQLSVGAPSSPYVSNTVMYDFDVTLNNYCLANSVAYTRYADDLIFSTNTPNFLANVERFVHSLIREIDYPKLKINESKTAHISKGRGRRVTGVILTPEEKLSIGRDRKRLIRASVDHFVKGKLSDDEVLKLVGLLAFAKDIEPSFVHSIKTKYGMEVILSLRKRASFLGKLKGQKT